MIFSLNIETKYAPESPREGQSVVEIFVDGEKFAEYVYGYTEDEPVSYLVVHRDENELDHLEKAVIRLLEYYYHPSPEDDARRVWRWGGWKGVHYERENQNGKEAG